MTSEIKYKHKPIKYEEFEGSNLFRLKVAYSFILNRPIKISNIRADSTNPGMTQYEINFLKLVSEVSNGTKININQTGTGFTLIPGTITNNYGDELTFECDKSRCITYYAEGLIPICLYGKESLHIKLKGITNNLIDNSVDSFKMSTCVLLQKLIIGDTVEFKINKRGVLPNGIGEVYPKDAASYDHLYARWLRQGRQISCALSVAWCWWRRECLERTRTCSPDSR